MEDSTLKHSRAALAPEWQLLLCCGRLDLTAEQAAQLSALAPLVDWPRVLQLAREHCLLPLVYRHLKTVCPALVPPASLQTLHEQTQNNAVRAHYLAQLLVDILAQFQTAGLDVLPFKGPVLASLAYGKLSLRHYSDLDVLLPRADLARAEQVLLAQGFISKHPDEPALSTLDGQALPHHDPAYINADGVVLELHWALAPESFGYPFAELHLWERTLEIQMLGQRVRVPSIENQLLLACFNATKELWWRLEHLATLAQLIRAQPQLDWDYVLEVAARTRQRRVVLLGLLLAEAWFDAPLPAPVQALWQNEPELLELARAIHAILFNRDDIATRSTNTHFFRWRLCDRRRDKALYLLRHIFQSGSSTPLPWWHAAWRSVRRLGSLHYRRGWPFLTQIARAWLARKSATRTAS